MLDTMGHEMAKANGGSRESKQQTIAEHAEKIIAGGESRQPSDSTNGEKGSR